MLARTRLPYTHQWENPALLETIYPAREIMLRKFVAMYREIELGDMTDPAERLKVVEQTRTAMQAELDGLKAIAAPSKAEAARIKVLQETLKRGATSADAAWRDAVEWERAHRGEQLAGAQLMGEVRRLFATSAVPDWLEPLVLDYAGMRYKSAHGSYYSPVRLLYLIERQKGTWTTARADETALAQAAYEKRLADWETAGKDPATKKTRGAKPTKPKAVAQATSEKATLDMDPAAAVARLEAMHDAGEIPAWAWHKIVRLTELRTWYATTGWEDESQEKPAPGDTFWGPVLKAWTGDERVGKHGYGITGWRTETQRRNALVTTRMVCNELSEATQRQRGVSLDGGISKNAEQYAKAAASTAGAYLRKPTGPDDFRPGAALFWTNGSTWEEKEPDDSNKVRHISGATYPMPATPALAKAWTTWDAQKKAFDKEHKAWTGKLKQAKTDADKAALGAEPKFTGGDEPTRPFLEVPADGFVDGEGFTYTVKVGQPITRAKDGVTHWLRWRHQATVLKAMPGKRIFTFETTDALPGADHMGVSGFGVRTLDSLMKPGVFVGYIPAAGEVVAAPTTPPLPLEGVEFPDTIVDLFEIIFDL